MARTGRLAAVLAGFLAVGSSEARAGRSKSVEPDEAALVKGNSEFNLIHGRVRRGASENEAILVVPVLGRCQLNDRVERYVQMGALVLGFPHEVAVQGTNHGSVSDDQDR